MMTREDLMKLVTTVRLLPDDPHSLLEFMEHFNRACNALSDLAFEKRLFAWHPLQQAAYHWLRKEFGLKAAEAVVAIRKVAYAYSDSKRRGTLAHFRLRGAIPIYKHSYKRAGTVLVHGMRIPFLARPGMQLSGKHEAQLAYRRGKFVLYQVYELPDGKEPAQPADWLGCDLGIVNILADSDGVTYSGKGIDAYRRRYERRRAELQRKGTRAAKRKLQRISGKQARFQRDLNHQISKQVVAKAQDTGRGIALEKLKGIRTRITARRSQRARLGNWSFAQLRGMIEYKATLAGVRVQPVGARDTSRMCPRCGWDEKASRRNRDEFRCVYCGFAGPADTVAAWNIRARARGDAPMVARSLQRQVPVVRG
jgi:putative transposase